MTPKELAELRRQCEADMYEWYPPGVVLDLIDEVERLVQAEAICREAQELRRTIERYFELRDEPMDPDVDNACERVFDQWKDYRKTYRMSGTV